MTSWQMGLPTPVLASESIVVWIKANTKLGIMSMKMDDARVQEYVVILDQATNGCVNTRIQRDSAVRLNVTLCNVSRKYSKK